MRAADAGNAIAMKNLGLCYEKGRGVAKNEAKAAELYTRAGEAGDSTGLAYLGTC
jgi:uncharacterized protein